MFVNTLRLPLNNLLPWEFNLLPFMNVAETHHAFRVKLGWLWFYFVWIIKKEV